jgi:hypothetical protein
MAIEETVNLTSGADPFDAPIPGESLTSSPDAPQSYEKASRFSSEQEAVEEIFLQITEEDRLDEVLDLMRAEVPLEDIAQTILFQGFRQGHWNPDMMLMLIEPTIYVLAFIANYGGVKAVIVPEEDTGVDEDDEEMSALLTKLSGQGELPEEVTVGSTTLQRPSSVPDTLLASLEKSDTPSLLTEGEV